VRPNSNPAVSCQTIRRDLHALPQAVVGIDGLHGLKYLKAKNKALLARPPNGYVIDEFAP
jgi:DeoR/GlpR family transcriptional regulator of sugar metabolism